MNPSPIILFVYNRPAHLKKTVEALRQNFLAKESELFIFSDGPKDNIDKVKTDVVQQYVTKIKGFKKIHINFQNEHFGLANSVISGVTKVIEKYKKVIVLEDDLLATKNFLTFMNKALDFYEKDKRIFSITGYNHPIDIPRIYIHPVYLSYRCCSWGWGTWKNRWEKVDWDLKDYESLKSDKCAQRQFSRGGQDLLPMLDYQMKGYIDSWAIRWCYTHYKHNAYCLYPTVSKIKNNGFDGSGTHKTKMNVELRLDNSNRKFTFPSEVKINEEILHNFSKYFVKSLKIKIIENIKGFMFNFLKI